MLLLLQSKKDYIKRFIAINDDFYNFDNNCAEFRVIENWFIFYKQKSLIKTDFYPTWTIFFTCLSQNII